MLAYLGAVSGIAVALLMALTVFFAAPGQPTITGQTSAMASRPNQLAARENATTSVTARIGHWGRSVAPRVAKGGQALQMKSATYVRGKVHTANEISRKPSLHMLAGQERTRHWEYENGSDFQSRYMGYVDDPWADRSLVRRAGQ